MISVALAAYNGERYIGAQVDGILRQLGGGDELIVSDNCSTDATVAVVNGIGDPRVKIITCEKKGVTANFGNALSHTSGDIIFLSDQDDVWLDGRVREMAENLGAAEPALAVSGVRFTDADLNPVPSDFRFKRGYTANLIKNTYIGASLAFNRPLMNMFLPFPENLPMHDWYIGLFAEKIKCGIFYTERELTLYRRHANAVTGAKRAGIFQKISWRAAMRRAVKEATRRGSK